MRNKQGISMRVKVLGAAAGAGVVVAMGALTVAFGGTEAHATSGPAIGGAGDTVTQTTAATTLATPVASPAVKAPPYGAAD